MAITTLEYWFLSWIAKKNIAVQIPDIIELGEQHWHGDVSIELLKNDIQAIVKDKAKQQNLLNNLDIIIAKKDKKKIFDLAKIVYQTFFNYENICAIDLHGTEDALQLDLNQPVELDQTFDLVFNFGTGEHIFNVYQFFKTIHELTKPGGLMLHVMPFQGWVDHGFFNFQPTLYWDLAESNNYDVVGFFFLAGSKIVEVRDRHGVGQYLQNNPSQSISSINIYAVLQQSNEPRNFQIPMQKFFQVSTEEYWNLARDPFSCIAEKLQLREINLIVAPDWTQAEELVMAELEAVLESLSSHPEVKKMNLLVDFSNFQDDSEINPESALSAIVLNLLVEKGLDLTDTGPEISPINNLTEPEWQALLPQVQYRIALKVENTAVIAKLGKMQLFELKKINLDF